MESFLLVLLVFVLAASLLAVVLLHRAVGHAKREVALLAKRVDKLQDIVSAQRRELSTVKDFANGSQDRAIEDLVDTALGWKRQGVPATVGLLGFKTLRTYWRAKANSPKKLPLDQEIKTP